MGSTLTALIIEAHQAEDARAARDGTDAQSLRVDHVLFDRAHAALVLAAFESLGNAAAAPEVVLASMDRCAPEAAGDLTDPVKRLVDVARRRGAHVARPGSGRCELVHRERFATPRKLVLAASEGAPTAGALGMLALRAGSLETASVLAGSALHLTRPRVIGIVLEGELASWVGGQDLALEILGRLTRRARGAVIELTGPGLASLSMADRMAVAALGPEVGATAVVFPSDDVTRRFLKAQGREADWKALEGGEDPGFDESLKIDLGAVEPAIAPREDPGAIRPVRHAMGMEVACVLIGDGASYADLARVARVLGGQRVHAATELVIVPGSRQVLDTAAATGVLEALRTAGARVLAGGFPPRRASAWRSSPRAGLCFGAESVHREDPGTIWYLASPETCAAAARGGELIDPRALDLGFERHEEPETYALPRDPILKPLAAAAGAAPDHPRLRAFPTGRPLNGPLRGTVLLKLGDEMDGDRILPWGARMARLDDDLDELAGRAFAALNVDFVRRARRHRGGFVVAGWRFGGGVLREQAALAPLTLGVRAILSLSFEPEFRRQLVTAGVLPLRMRIESDYSAIDEGDELEIPGLPEALEPGKPLVIRNLTRGTQHTLVHELEARDVGVIRAGGLLSYRGTHAPRPVARGA